MSARAAAFWAKRLGCAASVFERPGVTVVRHPLERVYAMAVGDSLIVAAPEALRERFANASEPRALVTPEGLRPYLPAVERFVGPARILYLERPLAEPAGVDRIDSVSDSRVVALRGRVTAEEWEHANLAAAEPPLFAVLLGGEVGAASGFERLDDRVAHLGVLADPRVRGRGLGRVAVQAAAAHAQSLGLLAQYQTLAANVPALRIAESLGFELFAVTLSARLS